jgi:hypothetical protein
VHAIGGRALFAMVTEHREAPSHPDEGDLWVHERVVEDLMHRSTVLPMRFGSTIADGMSLLAMLEDRRHEFETLIESLRGTVELSVRAQFPTVQPEPTQPATGHGGFAEGSAYLLQRHAEQRAADDVRSRIHEPLAGLARGCARKPMGLRRDLFKAAYLVDLERVEEFRTRVESLATEMVGARIACTGPWPPYSFSSEAPV